MEEEKGFAELVDESMNVPGKGKVFKGLVVRIDHDDVFIDFGSKSEGVAPTQEFYNKSGALDVNIGDEVEVMLDSWVSEGLPRLSKIKAEQIRENKTIQEHFEKGELVKAKILQKVKGGLIADIGNKIEIRAFIPGSQIDIGPRQDLDSLIGETIEARIIKLTGNDIVLSRRVYLEEEREVLKKETLAKLEEGKEITGKVVNIINQGVFVDLGGIEGFIPVSELSWGRVSHPGDVTSRDQEIKTVVLKIDEGNKIKIGRASCRERV